MRRLTILLSILVFAFCLNCRGGKGIPTLTPYPPRYQISVYPEDAGTLDIAGKTSFVVTIESLTGHRIPEDIKMKTRNGEIIGVLDYPEPITSIYGEIKAFIVIASVEPQFELEVKVDDINKRTFKFPVNVVPPCRWRNNIPSEVYYVYATPPSWKLQSLVQYAINFWSLLGIKFIEIPKEIMAPFRPLFIIYDGLKASKADINCEICKIFVKTEGNDLRRGAAHVFGHSLGLFHSPRKERMALMGVESYEELKDIEENPAECISINEPRFHWHINPSRLLSRIQPY
jgi:hypothetical protein